SKLEAVGLLHTVSKYNTANDEFIYYYRLQAPMNPYEFFQNQHLTLLLRDHIGKHAVLHLYDEFCKGESGELTGEWVDSDNISVPFYELFSLNSNLIDYELEETLSQLAPTVERRKPLTADSGF